VRSDSEVEGVLQTPPQSWFVNTQLENIPQGLKSPLIYAVFFGTTEVVRLLQDSVLSDFTAACEVVPIYKPLLDGLRDEQHVDSRRRHNFGQFPKMPIAFGYFDQRLVDGIFSASRVDMQFLNRKHGGSCQKKTVFNSEPRGVNQIGSHIPSLPGCGAFEIEEELRSLHRRISPGGWRIALLTGVRR
jgi:hypothetical protein